MTTPIYLMPAVSLTGAAISFSSYHLLPRLSQTIIRPSATMGSEAPPPRRPFCHRCSKPAPLCLCARLNFPQPLNNPIAVTVLQHTLESKHPLNSTRLAKIGLRNLSLLPVSDVNFHARLLIRPLPNNPQSAELEIIVHRSAKPNIADSPIARAAAANGFTVSKLQRKQVRAVDNVASFVDFVEFEATVPPGTVVLFPSDKAVGLREVGFQVKNLVVLDGTWGKATRMYHENPWLQLLPHVRLDMGRESLYSEVRHQPKAGCLSTIESIVCAMKGLGGQEEMEEGLDKLLEVFESMVEDQRRCKDDKMRRLSSSSSLS